MEETKIWAVEGTSATPLNTTNQMESEGLLENILTANPDMLEDGLQLVGRQTSTTGGPLDLLGVDNDGRLVVYELKRGRLNRDAVAQVIDYASDLASKGANDLSRHIEEQSGNFGIEKIDDFKDWYSKLRASNELSEEDIEALKPPRMVLVGLGVDDTTERMVNYLANGGLPISLLTFHGFVNSEGKTLLARQVEVNIDRIAPNQVSHTPPANRRAQFEKNVQTLPEDVRSVLDAADQMFRSQSVRFFIGHSTTRINFSSDFSWSPEYGWGDGTRAKRRVVLFLEIDESKRGINVGFNPLAVHFAPEEFESLDGANIQFVTVQTQALWGTQEYKFPLNSLEEWNAHKDTLAELTQQVCEAYNFAKAKA